MGPTHRAWTGALGVLTLWLGAGPAAAQLLGPAPEPLEFVVNPLDRSPRLQGMGGLLYTLDDDHNQIGLWDFARNPIGLLDDHDSSSVEVWGATASDSRLRSETFGHFRQSLSERDWDGLGEVWHRSKGELIYGADARYLNTRRDVPFSDQAYVRGTFGDLVARPTLAGKVKWVESGRMRWALRGNFVIRDQNQEYRVFQLRPGGEYLGGTGGLVPIHPNLFDPNSGFLSGTGLGGALDYKAGGWVDVALSGDYVGERLQTENDTKRSLAQYNQRRPFAQGALAMVGRLGSSVEWAADGRVFRSAADQDYYFTISAGIAKLPLTARGNRLSADQNGSALNGRVLIRLPLGIRLGGGGGAYYEKLAVVPPAAGDPSSYNVFLDHLYTSEPDADSLALPDSVSRSTRKVHAYHVGGGAGWQPSRHASLGVEYHYLQDRRDALVAGAGEQGPYSKSWEVRGGAEYRCTERLAARAGFVYTKSDQDILTDLNEFVDRTLTLGAGYYPQGASWLVETGYRVQWFASDFGDASRLHGSHQTLALNVRWLF